MKVEYHSTLEPRNYYHLYNKAVSGREMFVVDSDCVRFLEKFNSYFEPYLNLVAYCLIPNHFHFLVQVKELSDLTTESLKKEKTKTSIKFLSGEGSYHDFLVDQFRRYMSSHSLYINKKHKLQGPLFLKKMKKVKVKSENKLFDLLCYIHHNPIHHGIVYEYDKWIYSSYNDYIQNPTKGDYAPILRELGNDDIKVGLAESLRLHKEYKDNFLEYRDDKDS